MSYPVFDNAIMPTIVRPASMKYEQTKRYLGRRGRTGKGTITLKLESHDGLDSAEMEALYTFWRDDCNYGTLPFLISAPFFGAFGADGLPDLIVRFSGQLDAEYDNKWQQTLTLNVIATMDIAVDGDGNIAIDDYGNYAVGETYVQKDITIPVLAGDAANTSPVASNDSVTLEQDGSVDIDVIVNDSDSDGSLSEDTVTIVTDASHGSTLVAANGIVTYTPTPGYFGSDSFTYTVTDNEGAVSNIATVSITVTAVNTSPVASNDSVTLEQDGSVDIDVIVNDSDSDGSLSEDTVTIVTDASHGSTLVAANGIVTYTPTPGYFGSDSFTYTVTDNEGAVSNIATVSITVTAVNIAFSYDLEAPLQAGTGDNTGYYMLLNSDTGSYDARITNADGTAPDAGTDWPTVYPENGRIVGPYYIEPVNQPTGSFDLFYTRFIDVDGAGKWQDVLLSYDSASSTADVTVGDEANPLDTTPVYSENGLTYSPPAVIRFGDDFLLPGIPNATWGSVGNLDVGQTDKFYISFITPPANFSLSNLSVPAEVSVANLVDYGWSHKVYIYGFDVTGVSAGSASITFEGSSGQVSDSFGNLSTADSQSPTFTIASTSVTYYLSLDLTVPSIAGPSGVTINSLTDPNDTTQYALLDSSGNDTGSTFQLTTTFDGYYDGVGVNTGDDSGVLFDRMFEDSYRAKYGPGVIDLQLPAGVCTITASGSGTDINFNSECECFDSSGASQGVDGYNTNSNVSDYAQWANVVSDGTNPIRIKALDQTISSSGDRCLLSGLIITWSAS